MLVDILESDNLSACHAIGKVAGDNIHALGTSGDFAAFLHTLELAASFGIGFALHVVVIEGPTSRANEVRSTEKRRRACSNLLDFWY
jgi:hypothetical protein